MISKLYNLWSLLRNNLWFVPACMCAGFFVATLLLCHLETHYFENIDLPEGIFFTSPAGEAKTLSLTLLSSMLTMATLAISMTMVALSLAASQLGPRLIKTFMSDNKTKYYIGMFFGVVIAIFTLTIILYNSQFQQDVPAITITSVFMLCFLNLFILLAFFHHVAHSCIADNIILKVSEDLHSSLNRLTASKDKEDTAKSGAPPSWPFDFKDHNAPFCFENSGYVQHINYDQIAHIAKNNDLLIEIDFKAGHFLVSGEDGVRVYPASRMSPEIAQHLNTCFIIGETRTPTQDLEYSIRHLVEIAIRALSPGINDTFTAISVLNHLSQAMATLFQKALPSEWIEDDKNVVRVKAKQNTEADIIFSAFDQIRVSGRNMPHLLLHLAKKLKILSALTVSDLQKKGLEKQVHAVAYDLERLGDITHDGARHMKYCQEILQILSKPKSGA